MGAMCGKEDHFDSLGTGNTLERQPTPHQPRQKPAPRPQRLGGTGGAKADLDGTDSATRSGPDREAMLKAAEARSRAAKTRGTTEGGSLSKKLERQAPDGGRSQEARQEAERRGDQPLVWD